MEVTLYKGDDGGCALYRIVQPATHCGLRDFTITNQLPGERGLTANGRQVVAGVKKIAADVVVMPRPYHPMLAQAIPYIRRQGIAVVVDLDDDLLDVPRLHGAYPAFKAAERQAALKSACRDADLITCSTAAIARRYSKFGTRTLVLPNYVDAAWCNITAPRLDDRPRIGWTGNVGTHPHDLPVTAGGVNDGMEGTDAVWVTVGKPAWVHDFLELKDVPYDEPGWVPLDRYPEVVASLDIGIAPLADIPFNRAKSHLKPLEYAALGVCGIVTPLPEYAALVSNQLASAASTRTDWRELVHTLITSPDLRTDLAATRRGIVRDRYTIQQHAWRWAEAWELARMIRASSPAPRVTTVINPLTGRPQRAR